jgi:hypothetical protein
MLGISVIENVKRSTLVRFSSNKGGVVKVSAIGLVGVLLTASVGRADVGLSNRAEPRRGWLTGFGAGMIGLSLLSGGLGLMSLSDAGEAKKNEEFYAPPGGAPEQRNATIYLDEVTRGQTALAAGIVFFSLAAASLVTGIVCIVLDRPVPTAGIAFVPSKQGGAMVVSASF